MAVTPHLFRTHFRCDGRAAAPEAGRPDFTLPTLSSMDPVLLKSGLCPPGTSTSLRRTPGEVGSPSSLERRRRGLQKTARTLLAGKFPGRRGRWDGQFLRPRRTALSSQTPLDHIETPTGISAEILSPGFEQLRVAGPSRGPSDEHTSSFLSLPWTPELSALRVQLPRTAGGSPRTRGTAATPDHPCPFSLAGPPSMLSCLHRGTRVGPPPRRASSAPTSRGPAGPGAFAQAAALGCLSHPRFLVRSHSRCHRDATSSGRLSPPPGLAGASQHPAPPRRAPAGPLPGQEPRELVLNGQTMTPQSFTWNLANLAKFARTCTQAGSRISARCGPRGCRPLTTAAAPQNPPPVNLLGQN